MSGQGGTEVTEDYLATDPRKLHRLFLNSFPVYFFKKNKPESNLCVLCASVVKQKNKEV